MITLVFMLTAISLLGCMPVKVGSNRVQTSNDKKSGDEKTPLVVRKRALVPLPLRREAQRVLAVKNVGIQELPMPGKPSIIISWSM